MRSRIDSLQSSDRPSPRKSAAKRRVGAVALRWELLPKAGFLRGLGWDLLSR
jgi:hypothetical protein